MSGIVVAQGTTNGRRSIAPGAGLADHRVAARMRLARNGIAERMCDEYAERPGGLKERAERADRAQGLWSRSRLSSRR